MPQLRQARTTKEWGISATERSKRPHSFRNPPKTLSEKPSYQIDCPFRGGNEHLSLMKHLPTGSEAFPTAKDGG